VWEPIYGLSIFFSVKITGIENGAYGKSAKAAVLAFIPVIIFVFLSSYFHPLAAYILAIFLFFLFSVKITGIENGAYGRSVKAAVLERLQFWHSSQLSSFLSLLALLIFTH